MVLIEVFSSGSATAEFISNRIEVALKAAGVEYHLNEIYDVNVFLLERLDSIPAVRINNENIYYFNSGSIMTTLLNVVIQDVLALDEKEKLAH